VIVILEALGAAACWWCHQAFDLRNPRRRQRFLTTGQIDRSLLPPGPDRA
jgi:hypothetical protein